MSYYYQLNIAQRRLNRCTETLSDFCTHITVATNTVDSKSSEKPKLLEIAEEGKRIDQEIQELLAKLNAFMGDQNR